MEKCKCDILKFYSWDNGEKSTLFYFMAVLSITSFPGGAHFPNMNTKYQEIKLHSNHLS